MFNLSNAVKNVKAGMEAGSAIKAASYDGIGYVGDGMQIVGGAIETVGRAIRHTGVKVSDYGHGHAAEKNGKVAEPRRFFVGLDNPAVESATVEEKRGGKKKDEASFKDKDGRHFGNRNRKVEVAFAVEGQDEPFAFTREFTGIELTSKGEKMNGVIYMKGEDKKTHKGGYWNTYLSKKGEEKISVRLFFTDAEKEKLDGVIPVGMEDFDANKGIKMFFPNDKVGRSSAGKVEAYIRSILKVEGNKWGELEPFGEEDTSSAKEEVKKAPAKSAKKTAAAKKEGKKTATKKAEEKKPPFKADTKTAELMDSNEKLTGKLTTVAAEYDLGMIEYNEEESNEKVAVFLGTATDNTRFGEFSITLSTGNFKKKFAWQ